MIAWFKKPKQRPTKYRLDAADYTHLLLGGELRIHDGNLECHLIMADIGYGKQIDIINAAIMANTYRIGHVRNVEAKS